MATFKSEPPRKGKPAEAPSMQRRVYQTTNAKITLLGRPAPERAPWEPVEESWCKLWRESKCASLPAQTPIQIGTVGGTDGMTLARLEHPHPVAGRAVMVIYTLADMKRCRQDEWVRWLKEETERVEKMLRAGFKDAEYQHIT